MRVRGFTCIKDRKLVPIGELGSQRSVFLNSGREELARSPALNIPGSKKPGRITLSEVIMVPCEAMHPCNKPCPPPISHRRSQNHIGKPKDLRNPQEDQDFKKQVHFRTTKNVSCTQARTASRACPFPSLHTGCVQGSAVRLTCSHQRVPACG